MKVSIARKLMVPACTMTFLGALLAGWVFSSFASYTMEKTAASEMATSLEHFELLLDTAHTMLAERVTGSMKVLQSDARRAGGPSQGALVTVGSESVPDLLLGGQPQANRFDLVDGVASRMGGTATLFTRRGEAFIRVSTNVKKADTTRAIGTPLDPNGKAILALRQGNAFYGLVDILGNPYLTGYEPLKDAAGQTVGILYVGYKITALEQLAATLSRSRILENGFLTLLDQKGQVLFSHEQRPKEAIAAILKEGQQQGNPWRIFRRGFEKWGFTLVAAYPESDVTRTLWLIRSLALGAGLAGVLGVAVIFYQIVRRRLLDPVNAVMGGIQRKDLTLQITGLSDDEIGELGRAYNASNAQFRGIFQELARGSEQVATESAELKSTVEEMRSGSEEIARAGERQSTGMGSVGREMERLSELITRVERGIEASKALSQEAVTATGQGAASGQAAAQSMEAIRTATARMAQAIGVIQDIARQTNLLSLNAAIEAAKAGVQGKGFAVVADEVRKLAERSALSTREIRALIEQVDAVVKQGTEAVGASGTATDAIQRNIASLVQSSEEIAAAMRAEVVTRDEVRAHLDQARGESERSGAASAQLAATISEVARTSGDLARIADGLAQQVARYKI
jgi:methyl-accepting chemotaxis protein